MSVDKKISGTSSMGKREERDRSQRRDFKREDSRERGALKKKVSGGDPTPPRARRNDVGGDPTGPRSRQNDVGGDPTGPRARRDGADLDPTDPKARRTDGAGAGALNDTSKQRADREQKEYLLRKFVDTNASRSDCGEDSEVLQFLRSLKLFKLEMLIGKDMDAIGTWCLVMHQKIRDPLTHMKTSLSKAYKMLSSVDKSGVFAGAEARRVDKKPSASAAHNNSTSAVGSSDRPASDE